VRLPAGGRLNGETPALHRTLGNTFASETRLINEQ
jgi:hypothetical protein